MKRIARTEGVEQYVQMAARENAEWCDAVCRSHGLVGEFRPHAWTSASRTPPLYPDAVTLTATASATEVLVPIDTTSPGASIKDSFACLDLTSAGFHVLLDAHWFHRPADRPVPRMRSEVRWVPVRTPEGLHAWETAWAGDQSATAVFRAELLTEGSVIVLAGRLGNRIVSGAIAHATDEVVGISNLFAADGDGDGAWAGAFNAVARHVPGLPIVGYEHGPALDTAIRHGCTPIGPLLIWMQTG